MNYNRKILPALLGTILLVSASVTACTSNTENPNSESASNASSKVTEKAAGNSEENANADSVSITRLDTTDLFSNRDKEVGYDESSSIAITLSDNGCSSSSEGVAIDGSIITITQEGTYILSGSLSDGQIRISAGDTDKVQLVLKDAAITSKTSAPIYISSADKVFITMAEGSSNSLSTTDAFVAIDENNIDAVIFSKSDLTLNGNGSLTIQCAQGHGIVSKDDLVITSGTYQITASNHALSGKDSVLIADGSFTLNSGKDAIHSENTDDTSRGYVYISGGSFHFQCDGDGIDASNIIQIEGGEFTIASTAGKGVKSDSGIFLSDTSMNISTEDDSIHSNNDIEITSGTYTITSGDDGIHSDMDLVINGGTFDIQDSYEGIEALNITINGGEFSVVSSDDGFNAAGGNDESGFSAPNNRDAFGGDGEGTLVINDGNIFVNARGDGLDSNGELIINGGTVYVSGPSDNGNGALDSGTSAVVNGGVVVAAGASGMAENFDGTSTQCAMMVTLSATATGTITLTDSNGKELVSFDNPKSFNNVVISCPEIESDGTYTVSCGDISTTVQMNGTIYGSSSGMGGGPMGGGMKGDFDGNPKGDFGGDMQGDFDGDMPEDFGGGKNKPDMPSDNH